MSYTSKTSYIHKNCPLAAKLNRSQCQYCKVQINDGTTVLLCHCGRQADISRKENALSHWSSKFCISETLNKAATGGGIKSFFIKNTSNSDDPDSKRQRTDGPTLYPCVGLNDVSWERKRAKPEHSIKAYVMASPSVFHGHLPRHKLAEQYFDKSYRKLTTKEKEELEQIKIANSKWQLIRTSNVICIRSTKCTSLVERQGYVERNKVVCHECWELRKEPALVDQLNHDYASKDTQKFIQNAYLKQDPFIQFVVRHNELKHLAQSIEKVANRNDEAAFWKVLCAHAENGAFKNSDVLVDLIKAVASKTERINDNKTLRGLTIGQDLYDFFATIAAVSPAAGRLFYTSLHGYSDRTLRLHRRREALHIIDGFEKSNFERVAQKIKELGYNGPLSCATDETVCTKSLRFYDGKLVGAVEGDIDVTSLQEIKDVVERVVREDGLASKIRIYAIQIPLPKMPTFVAVLRASAANEDAEMLLSFHHSFIENCHAVDLNPLAIGTDGAAVEFNAQSRFGQSTPTYHTFMLPTYDIDLKIPLVNGKPIVMVQDPKHARKTASNQILSGARCLSFGRFTVSIQHLSRLVDSGALYKKDVFNVDKQDDGRAYRLFCDDTLEAALNDSELEGLVVLLFVFGEMADAWLSRKMTHADRVVAAFTAEFFLRGWDHYLDSREKDGTGLMSKAKNGISHQSRAIFARLADSLLSLNICFQHYYPEYPFLPWKFGSEIAEHLFGLFRMCMADFTVLDARNMIPKIFQLSKAITMRRISMPSSHLHSGYSVDYFLDPNADDEIHHLKNRPSPDEIPELLRLASLRARCLLDFCRMPAPSIFTKTVVPESVHVDADIGDVENEDNASISGCKNISSTREAIIKGALNTIRDKSAAESFIETVEEAEEISSPTQQESAERQRITIAQIVNQSSSTTVSIPHTELIASNIELNKDAMLLIRKDHDSELKKGQGNEKKKKSMPANTIQTTDSDGAKLIPNQASKFVAVLLKSETHLDSAIARMHRWNIQVKIPLEVVSKNTSIRVDNALVYDLLKNGGAGAISESNKIENGKFCLFIMREKLYVGKVKAVFEYIASKHRWVLHSSNRPKLSYVSVQTFFYSKSQLTATPIHAIPGQLTFTHLPISRIVYVFPPTESRRICDLPDGSISFPSDVIKMLAEVFGNDRVLKHMEQQINSFKQ